MERMKDLTQQYVEQLNNMVKDLREKKLELEEENKNLKEKIERLEFDVDAWHQLKLLLEGEIEKLRGLQICGKTVAQWIEEDKKVVRE